WPRFADKSGLW
ncbi:hypothetical protein TUA1478L_32340, partial [Lactiplantibacillus plantarum]